MIKEETIKKTLYEMVQKGLIEYRDGIYYITEKGLLYIATCYFTCD